MKTVFEACGENPFTNATTKSRVTVEQEENQRGLFRVTYGLQVKEGLTYGMTCLELGKSVLHHLAREGIVNNEGL